MEKVTLAYWPGRGLAQPLRHLLAYTGIEFEDKVYPGPEKWFNEDKLNLGFDFPNLPYLIDNGFKLTESIAIARYIVKRSGRTELWGKTPQDQGKVDNILGVINDAMKDIRALFWNKDYKHLKDGALANAKPKLEYLRKFIGDKPFALEYLTIVDFIFSEHLYYFEKLYPDEVKNYPFWSRIRHNFNGLPEIQSYYARPETVHWPFAALLPELVPTPKTVKLAYWGIRGLGQVPRLLLAYSKVDFEDYHYTDSEKWFQQDKIHLGLNFPNLPYLIDGDYNITESTAIQRYIIGRWGKTDLLGKNIQDNANVESILSVFTEISSAIKGLFFNPEHEAAKGPILEKYKVKLDQLNTFAGEKAFILGYLTLADFVIAEDSHYIETVFHKEYKHWPFLQRIR